MLQPTIDGDSCRGTRNSAARLCCAVFATLRTFSRQSEPEALLVADSSATYQVQTDTNPANLSAAELVGTIEGGAFYPPRVIAGFLCGVACSWGLAARERL